LGSPAYIQDTDRAMVTTRDTMPAYISCSTCLRRAARCLGGSVVDRDPFGLVPSNTPPSTRYWITYTTVIVKDCTCRSVMFSKGARRRARGRAALTTEGEAPATNSTKDSNSHAAPQGDKPCTCHMMVR